MDHPLIDLIDARIREAEARGDFDDLPGAGKPLPECDDPENALLNRLTKEAGGVPPHVLLARELEALRLQLREEPDRTERRRVMKEISMMEARIDMAQKSWSR